MGLSKNTISNPSSTDELANQLDDVSPSEAGKFLQRLTGNVSDLLTTVVNGEGQFNADPELLAFNPKFTRESFGKAAVSDSVVIKPDRKGYLLDDRQKPTEKAKAIIASLENHNGLDILKNEITDTEFTNQLAEPNLNVFDEYPEGIFVNASELSSTAKQKFIFDAIVASQDTMDGLGSSQLALQAVTSLEIAESEIDSSEMAASKYITAHAGEDHTSVSSYSDIVSNNTRIKNILDTTKSANDLANLSEAVEAVLSSSVARTELSASTTGLEQLSTSNTVMDVIKATNAYMDYIFGSELPLDLVSTSTGVNKMADVSYFITEIKNQWNKVTLTDGESPAVAPLYLAHLYGAGAGSGYENTHGSTYAGSDGGDSTFGPAIGEGGVNNDQGDAPDGGASVSSSKAAIVSETVGGGAAGACDSWCGGDGGFAEALVSNDAMNSLSASVGTGGSGDDWENNGNPESGSDGSVEVWVPPTA